MGKNDERKNKKKGKNKKRRGTLYDFYKILKI